MEPTRQEVAAKELKFRWRPLIGTNDKLDNAVVIDLLLSISLTPRDLAQTGVLSQGAGYMQ